MEAVKTLPKGYMLIDNLNQLKTLKKGRKAIRPENIVFKYGVWLYMYSPEKKVFYPRLFSKITPIAKVEEYINKGILYGPE